MLSKTIQVDTGKEDFDSFLGSMEHSAAVTTAPVIKVPAVVKNLLLDNLVS